MTTKEFNEIRDNSENGIVNNTCISWEELMKQEFSPATEFVATKNIDPWTDYAWMLGCENWREELFGEDGEHVEKPVCIMKQTDEDELWFLLWELTE